MLFFPINVAYADRVTGKKNLTEQEIRSLYIRPAIMVATSLKGVGELCRDGGWLEFKSERAGEKFFQDNFGGRSGYVYAKCRECF